jgi:hypothetical protein
MMRFALSGSALWRTTVLGCSIVLFAYGFAALQQASAASGPFAEFPGSWSGTGTIRIGDKTERVRCNSTYSLQGSNERYVVVQLTCTSDSYKFDLSGEFQADESNHISGNWNERSRGVGGTASGNARGDRFQIHIDSQVFSGNMVMVTRGSRQSVTIDTIGTEDKVSTSVTLQKGSR